MSNAYVFVSASNTSTFTNTLIGDVIISSQSNNQKILIGNNSNSIANLTMTSNASYFMSGNVGIGTSTPGYALHVVSSTIPYIGINATSAAVNANLVLNNLYSSSTLYQTSNTFQVSTGPVANGTQFTPLTISANTGNVGIGKFNPAYTLDVSGNICASSNLIPSTNNSGSIGLISQLWNTVNATYGYFGGQAGAPGYLSIGGSLAGYPGGSAQTLQMGISGTSIFWQNAYIQTLASGVSAIPNLNILIGSTNTMTITQTGVGIGTTTPAHKLDVIGNASFGSLTTAATVYLNDIANAGWYLSTGGFQLGFYNNNGGSYNAKAVITNAGYVGIGTTTPNCPLYVNGNTLISYGAGYYFAAGQASLTYLASFNNQTSIYANQFIISGVGFIAASDSRIKENIAPYQDNVYDLNPVTYQYIDKIEKGSKHKYGFIAQEVEKSHPNCVMETTEYIPNIFKVVPTSLNTISLSNHGINMDQKIKLISKDTKKEILTSVKEVIDNDHFVVDTDISESDTIFFYGVEVEDFRVIDHDQLLSVAINTIKKQKLMIDKLTDDINIIKAKLGL